MLYLLVRASAASSSTSRLGTSDSRGTDPKRHGQKVCSALIHLGADVRDQRKGSCSSFFPPSCLQLLPVPPRSPRSVPAPLAAAPWLSMYHRFSALLRAAPAQDWGLLGGAVCRTSQGGLC